METKDGQHKFGSAYKTKRYDSYHAEAQPKTEATPEYHDGDNANLEGADKHAASGSAMADSTPRPHEVVAEHGPAHTIHYEHQHDAGQHKVTSMHADGHMHESMHGSAKEACDSACQLAHEAGGEEQASDVKRREHPDQQGAESEEKGYEMPDLA